MSEAGRQWGRKLPHNCPLPWFLAPTLQIVPLLKIFRPCGISNHCQKFSDAPSINWWWEMVLKKWNINTPKNTYLNCFEYSWRIMSHNIHCLMQWVIWYWYLFYNIRVPLLFFPLIPLQPGTMLNPSFLLVGLLSLVGLTWAFREPK